MYLKIRSRHPSHDLIRKSIRINRPATLRLGSFTPSDDIIQINSVDSCINSSNKSAMKRLFVENNVKTAKWCFPTSEAELNTWIITTFGNEHLDSKVIVKSLRGSRGKGLYLMTANEAIAWFRQRGFGGHIIEKYYNYNREYRLHVAKDGCFYTCRKMLKTDATERWYRNDSNCVWITEENPQFDKPINWDTIVEHCVKALNAVGLDLGACDVRVQSSDNRTPDFIICEINSAPSFGTITLQKYKTKICAILADILV